MLGLKSGKNKKIKKGHQSESWTKFYFHLSEENFIVVFKLMFTHWIFSEKFFLWALDHVLLDRLYLDLVSVYNEWSLQ
jgi:hypothetical protein